MKLKTTEVPQYRAQQLKRQKHICPLCKKLIRPEDATLDHDHVTGHVRKVLHRQCNSVEGRVLHWLRRVGRAEPEEFIRNLLRYWSYDYTVNPHHPNHGRKRRRRKRRK